MTYVRPDIDGTSDLVGYHVPELRDATTPDRTQPVYGVCLHTTGSGIVEQARKHGADPFEYAVAHYLRPEAYFAHFVIGYSGVIAQIADEHERAPHVGISKADRAAYILGDWKTRCSAKTVDLWCKRWCDTAGGVRSPCDLYPGASVNDCMVGIELVPLLGDWTKDDDYVGKFTDGYRSVCSFTTFQHESVAALCRDIARRWGLPRGWEGTPRLVGHEDLSPLTRSDKGGGWDPGALREAPRIDLPYVRRKASV